MIRQKLTIEQEQWINKNTTTNCPTIFVLALVPNNGLFWKYFGCYSKDAFEKLGDVELLVKKCPGFTRTVAIKVFSAENDTPV